MNAEEQIAAVLAYHRCQDVHPERHDMGGPGICRACKSWGSHVATVLVPLVEQAKAEALLHFARHLFDKAGVTDMPEQVVANYLVASAAALSPEDGGGS